MRKTGPLGILIRTAGDNAVETLQGFWNGRAHLVAAQQQIRGYVDELINTYDATVTQSLELPKAGELLTILAGRLVDLHGEDPNSNYIVDALSIASKIIPAEEFLGREMSPEDKESRERYRRLSHLIGSDGLNRIIRERLNDTVKRLQNEVLAELARENSIP